jgi:hypothetical protein
MIFLDQSQTRSATKPAGPRRVQIDERCPAAGVASAFYHLAEAGSGRGDKKAARMPEVRKRTAWRPVAVAAEIQTRLRKALRRSR